MNTLDLLERAHARLTELRDASTPGPWAKFLTATGPGTGDITVGPDDSDVEFLIGRDMEGEDDADLIVALHCTLEAQLKILSNAMGDSEGSHDEPGSYGLAVELARAILGE